MNYFRMLIVISYTSGETLNTMYYDQKYILRFLTNVLEIILHGIPNMK